MQVRYAPKLINQFIARIIEVKLSNEQSLVLDKARENIYKEAQNEKEPGIQKYKGFKIVENDVYEQIHVFLHHVDMDDERILNMLGGLAGEIANNSNNMQNYTEAVKVIHDAIEISEKNGFVSIDKIDLQKINDAWTKIKFNQEDDLQNKIELPVQKTFLKNKPTPGWVEPLKITFKDKDHQNGKSPEEQARIIIERVLDLVINHSVTKVGITYSANDEQTKSIWDAYERHESDVDIHGSNQAEVIYHLRRLLKDEYSHLQSVFDIIPITTCTAAKDPTKANWVKNDVRNAKKFVKQGGVLLGWQNQYTPPGEFAIGGGVAARSFSARLKNYVQSKLNKLANRYPPSGDRQKLVGTINKSKNAAVIKQKGKLPLSEVELINALFKTLNNPKAMLAWPLRITGIEVKDIPKEFIPPNMPSSLAVTRQQKEEFLVKWINHLEIANNKKPPPSWLKTGVDIAITQRKSFLPERIKLLFKGQQPPRTKDNEIYDYDFATLKTRYLNLLHKYNSYRGFINSLNPLAYVRILGVIGLIKALELCNTQAQLKEIITGSQYFHQTLRGTRSDLIPILKSLQYEMTPFLKEKIKKIIPLDQLQQPFSEKSNRKKTRALINEILAEKMTPEEKIRILNTFSQSLQPVGGKLNQAVNGSLQNLRALSPHSPITSPLRDFTGEHALAFINYVVDHENKSTFFQNDPDENRHLNYASKLAKNLLLCKTRKDLENIRDEALSMRAALKAYQNSHTGLIGMLEKMPEHINDFIKNHDLLSKNEKREISDFTFSVNANAKARHLARLKQAKVPRECSEHADLVGIYYPKGLEQIVDINEWQQKMLFETLRGDQSTLSQTGKSGSIQGFYDGSDDGNKKLKKRNLLTAEERIVLTPAIRIGMCKLFAGGGLGGNSNPKITHNPPLDVLIVNRAAPQFEMNYLHASKYFIYPNNPRYLKDQYQPLIAYTDDNKNIKGTVYFNEESQKLDIDLEGKQKHILFDIESYVHDLTTAITTQLFAIIDMTKKYNEKTGKNLAPFFRATLSGIGNFANIENIYPMDDKTILLPSFMEAYATAIKRLHESGKIPENTVIDFPLFGDHKEFATEQFEAYFQEPLAGVTIQHSSVSVDKIEGLVGFDPDKHLLGIDPAGDDNALSGNELVPHSVEGMVGKNSDMATNLVHLHNPRMLNPSYHYQLDLEKLTVQPEGEYTRLGAYLAKIPLDDSKKSKIRRCAMIQLLCHSDDPKDREFGQGLLLKATPEMIEEAKRSDPDCYYAQIYIIRLGLLGAYALEDNAIKYYLSELNTYVSSKGKPTQPLVDTLNKLKEVMKLALPQGFSFFPSSQDKNLKKMIDLLNGSIPTINAYSEKMKMKKLINDEMEAKEINNPPNIANRVDNIENDLHYNLYDAVSYFKENKHETLSWEDLKNTAGQVKSVAYQTLLEFLYYTIEGTQEPSFSIEDLALLHILKESVPEKIDGCEVKTRLNLLYDKMYVMQSSNDKKSIQKEIASIQARFDEIKITDKETITTFEPDMKKAIREEFAKVFSSILTDPEQVAKAITARGSIDFQGNITAEQLQFIQTDIDNKDKEINTTYRLHDPGRLGADLKLIGLIRSDLEGVSSYQQLVYEAVIFEAVTRLTRLSANNEPPDIKKAYDGKTTAAGLSSATIAKYTRDQYLFEAELMRLAKPLILEHIRDPNAFKNMQAENRGNQLKL